MNESETLIKYHCDFCNYSLINKNNFKRHLTTNKHLLNIARASAQPRVIPEAAEVDLETWQYSCLSCKYGTNDKCNYNKHLLTKKHLQFNAVNNVQSSLKNELYCASVSGNQSAHDSTVIQENQGALVCASPKDSVIIELLKQNQEFKELLIEQQKEMMEKQTELMKHQKELAEQNSKLMVELAHKDNLSITNNMQNNQFNLNFFLNEQCKNALNLSDFIDSIKVDYSSLENMGMAGYVEGITKIFVDELKQLDIYRRPIHCTDIKRETMHIKEEDKWDKDTEENLRIKRMIHEIAVKNMSQIKQWQEEHRECEVLDSNTYNLWFKIIKESLEQGGKADHKIIHNLAKYVYLDKGALANT